MTAQPPEQPPAQTSAQPPEQRPDRPFAAVWFDCDSTLSTVEGIDELAARRDRTVRDEVATLTARAMDGDVPLEQVYGARLERIAPTWAECGAIGVRYVEQLVPNAVEVCAALSSLGKTLGILSGGLRPCVEALARELGVPPTHTLAVGVLFNPDGGYAGFDAQSPLARADGKPEVLRARPAAERPLAMVGDGVTDLATQDVVDRFIGFGGVADRAAVRAGAEHYAAGPGLETVLPFLLTADERDRLAADPRFAALLG